MGIIQIIVLIAIVGVLVWAVTTYIPMPPPFKNIIIIVAVLAVCLWLLTAFGLLPHGPVVPR